MAEPRRKGTAITFKVIHKKKLEFLTQNDGDGWKKPVWKECEVINADFPECKRKMVVILAPAGYCYAECQSCESYYLAD